MMLNSYDLSSCIFHSANLGLLHTVLPSSHEFTHLSPSTWLGQHGQLNLCQLYEDYANFSHILLHGKNNACQMES